MKNKKHSGLNSVQDETKETNRVKRKNKGLNKSVQ